MPCHSHATTPADVLSGLQLAEERGDLATLASLLRRSERFMKAEGDQTIAIAVEAIEVRLAASLEHERIHGAGSLYRHEHPFNIRIKEWRQFREEWRAAQQGR